MDCRYNDCMSLCLIETLGVGKYYGNCVDDSGFTSVDKTKKWKRKDSDGYNHFMKK